MRRFDIITFDCYGMLIDCEFVIHAQQVQSYKPGLPHFLAARERTAGQRWLHAAQSNDHDIIPTNSLGIPNAWINRLRERALDDGEPTFEYRDMASFAK